jgi:hypothetical protein
MPFRVEHVTYSIYELLIYVHSDGRIVYLIRPTQPGDSYFGSDFTHYIYRELHKIYSWLVNIFTLVSLWI